MPLQTFLNSVDQEALQIARETVEGTPETTNFLILPSLKLTPKREAKFDKFKRSGSRHTSASRLNTSHTTLQVAGGADYNEIGFLTAGALRTPTSAAEGASLIAYRHVADVLASAPNPRRTYTAQWGSGAYVRQAAGIRFDSFGFKSARTGSVEVSGSAFALALQDSYRNGITKVAGAAAIEQSSMSGIDVGFYLATTPAGLDAAPLLADAFGGEVMLAAIAAAVWSQNRNESYQGSAEQAEQNGSCKLFLPVTNSYFNIYDELEQGITYYLRMQALGPEIETGINYEVTLDVAVKLDAAADEKDEQNVLAFELPFIWADDTDWGKSMHYEIVNTIASY